MASQDTPEVDAHPTATVLSLAQSSPAFRATAGNSSARRPAPSSSHENRPRSIVDSEDIPLQGLHHRISRSNTSRSRQQVENVAGNGSISSADRQDSDPITQATGSPPLNRSEGADQFPATKVAEDDARSVSVRSERTYLQRRDLGIIDVAALIINKQIGTGIFTTPGLVLSLTGSKMTSIIMWFCGGIWASLWYVSHALFRVMSLTTSLV